MNLTIEDFLNWQLPEYPLSSSSGRGGHQSSPENDLFQDFPTAILQDAETTFIEYKRLVELQMASTPYLLNTFSYYQVPSSIANLSSEAAAQHFFCANVCYPVVALANHLRPELPLTVSQAWLGAWDSVVAGKLLRCYFDVAVRDRTGRVVLAIEIKHSMPDNLDRYFCSKAFGKVSKQLRKYAEATGTAVILLGDYQQLISFHINVGRIYYIRTKLQQTRWHLLSIIQSLQLPADRP